MTTRQAITAEFSANPSIFPHLQITEIKGLEALVNLKVLDLSYNRISKIQGSR